MTRLRGLMGQPVVARDTAETVGQVHGAIIDPVSRRVLALQVGKGRKASVADWSALTGVGPDAAVVASEERLRPPAGDREERMVKGDVALLGGRVLTDEGDELGTLDDVEFDESSGELTAVVVGAEAIAADRLRSIGSYAVVVAAAASEDTTPPEDTAPAEDPAPTEEPGPTGVATAPTEVVAAPTEVVAAPSEAAAAHTGEAAAGDAPSPG